MKTKMLLVLVLLMLIPAFVLFAGGDKEEVIKIGSPLPLTGAYASDGIECQKAIELAIHELNVNGGLFGKQIELITGDVGELEAEKLQAVGERLLSEEVDVIMTGYDDGGTDVYIFGKSDIPYLHSNANSLSTAPVAENPEYRNCFQYCPNEIDYGIDAADKLFTIADGSGWTPPNNKVATIKVDYSYNIVPADKFNELAEEKGYEIVMDELTQFGMIEWGPILSKIEKEKPSFITFWHVDPMDAARFTNQLMEYFEGKELNALVFMQFTPAVPEYKELTGSNSDGILWTTLGGIIQDTTDFDKRFEALHGEPPQAMYAYWMYDAFMIWYEAVMKVGNVKDFDKINEEIRKTNYVGFGGTYVFDQNDQSALFGDDYQADFWYQIWDGEDHALLPTKFADSTFRLPPWLVK